jgi:hypothetical protein
MEMLYHPKHNRFSVAQFCNGVGGFPIRFQPGTGTRWCNEAIANTLEVMEGKTGLEAERVCALGTLHLVIKKEACVGENTGKALFKQH